MVEEGMLELDEFTGALFIAQWPNLEIPQIGKEGGGIASLRILAHPKEDMEEEEMMAMDELVNLDMGEWIGKRRREKAQIKCTKIYEEWNATGKELAKNGLEWGKNT
jgi:hypothetical protein